MFEAKTAMLEAGVILLFERAIPRFDA